MTSLEIIALIVTGVGVVCFAVIFTILYRSYAASSVAEIESGQRDVDLIEETILQNVKNSKKSKRVYDRVKRVLSFVAIVFLLFFLVFSIISKIQNGVIMIMDRGVIAVATGSMSEKHQDNTYLVGLDNQFMAYDMIVLEDVEKSYELNKYDVISYVNDEGVNIIHRIIDIEYTSSGPRYVTRGDANNAEDTYRPSFEDVVGRYTGTRIPYLGLFAMFLQSYSGIVTIAAIIYCLLMIERVGEKINRSENARLDFLAASIDFKTEKVISDGELESSFLEKVRYKNYIYTFDENGFVDKFEVSDEENKT